MPPTSQRSLTGGSPHTSDTSVSADGASHSRRHQGRPATPPGVGYAGRRPVSPWWVRALRSPWSQVLLAVLVLGACLGAESRRLQAGPSGSGTGAAAGATAGAETGTGLAASVPVAPPRGPMPPLPFNAAAAAATTTAAGASAAAPTPTVANGGNSIASGLVSSWAGAAFSPTDSSVGSGSAVFSPAYGGQSPQAATFGAAVTPVAAAKAVVTNSDYSAVTSVGIGRTNATTAVPSITAPGAAGASSRPLSAGSAGSGSSNVNTTTATPTTNSTASTSSGSNNASRIMPTVGAAPAPAPVMIAARNASASAAAAGGGRGSGIRIVTGDGLSVSAMWGPGGEDMDLVGPVLSGDMSGLFKHLPPNSTALISSYALRIDDMEGLVTPKGYPLEQHVVVTGDGYKLGTFRIPYGRSGQGTVRRPPVLLIHGISLASTCWVVNRPSESLAFILADSGYDVWMINTRGNTFSREHVKYRDTQSVFWRFSVDEMAKWDLRETLKYVQDVTGVTKVGIVGHSQGGTIALMALSDDPWLAESVSVLVALGPCAYVKYMKSVMLTSFCRQANTTSLFSMLAPQELIYMNLQMQQTYLNGVCQMPGTMVSCLSTMESIFGASRRITAAQYRRYWQIWPSSTSLGNALQWAEIYNEPKPRFFRQGYGAEYELERVRAPVVMVSGGADVLAASEDIAEQKRRLRQVLVREYDVPYYSHMDFIWDTGAASTVYPVILEALAGASA